ncbi:MAG TPA: ribosome biogenesis GTPase YlqF [Bacillota bacterium]|nr:ribosome biogenesis GTPase YlqF [Bacillota bacterium]
MNIQWFPGHMVKAKRMVQENLKLVDMVIELADARLPESSRNPDLLEIIGSKPRLLVLNKMDLADEKKTKQWLNWYRQDGVEVVAVNSNTGQGFRGMHTAAVRLTKEKMAALLARGQRPRPIRAMIVGIPNVGKSSFINRLVGKESAKAADRPGVTKGKQWVRYEGDFELLDTPGILWPKFDDPAVGFKLAVTGAIRDQILDEVELAAQLALWLKENGKEQLMGRYKLPELPEEGQDIIEAIGRRRGCLVAGGNVDLSKGAAILLDEFRGSKIGRFTMDDPGGVA